MQWIVETITFQKQILEEYCQLIKAAQDSAGFDRTREN